MASLPLGKKSLAETRVMPDPVDRLPTLVRLLEYVLDQIDPSYDDSRGTGIGARIMHHRRLFRDVRELRAAVNVRNALEHVGASRHLPKSRQDVERACEQVRGEIEGLLVRLSPAVALAVRGDGRSQSPAAVTTAPASHGSPPPTIRPTFVPPVPPSSFDTETWHYRLSLRITGVAVIAGLLMIGYQALPLLSRPAADTAGGSPDSTPSDSPQGPSSGTEPSPRSTSRAVTASPAEPTRANLAEIRKHLDEITRLRSEAASIRVTLETEPYQERLEALRKLGDPSFPIWLRLRQEIKDDPNSVRMANIYAWLKFYEHPSSWANFPPGAAENAGNLRRWSLAVLDGEGRAVPGLRSTVADLNRVTAAAAAVTPARITYTNGIGRQGRASQLLSKRRKLEVDRLLISPQFAFLRIRHRIKGSTDPLEFRRSLGDPDGAPANDFLAFLDHFYFLHSREVRAGADDRRHVLPADVEFWLEARLLASQGPAILYPRIVSPRHPDTYALAKFFAPWNGSRLKEAGAVDGWAAASTIFQSVVSDRTATDDPDVEERKLNEERERSRRARTLYDAERALAVRCLASDRYLFLVTPDVLTNRWSIEGILRYTGQPFEPPVSGFQSFMAFHHLVNASPRQHLIAASFPGRLESRTVTIDDLRHWLEFRVVVRYLIEGGKDSWGREFQDVFSPGGFSGDGDETVRSLVGYYSRSQWGEGWSQFYTMVDHVGLAAPPPIPTPRAAARRYLSLPVFSFLGPPHARTWGRVEGLRLAGDLDANPRNDFNAFMRFHQALHTLGMETLEGWVKPNQRSFDPMVIRAWLGFRFIARHAPDLAFRAEAAGPAFRTALDPRVQGFYARNDWREAELCFMKYAWADADLDVKWLTRPGQRVRR